MSNSFEKSVAGQTPTSRNFHVPVGVFSTPSSHGFPHVKHSRENRHRGKSSPFLELKQVVLLPLEYFLTLRSCLTMKPVASYLSVRNYIGIITNTFACSFLLNTLFLSRRQRSQECLSSRTNGTVPFSATLVTRTSINPGFRLFIMHIVVRTVAPPSVKRGLGRFTGLIPKGQPTKNVIGEANQRSSFSFFNALNVD